jgi:pyruvate formate lyase activating enzyme
MIQGTIFKIKKYALHDGPGIRTTVFLKGCPLACRWCHNPEGIDPEPQRMMRRTSSAQTASSQAESAKIDETVGTIIAANELIREIEKDVLFFDESGGGVTFSGGEPLAQPQFLEALLAACNHRDIPTALDTSGFAPAAVLDHILPRLQLVLFDLKLMDARQHRRYTGVSNRIILENLARIAESPTPLRIRVPLIPGITDGDDNLSHIVRFAAGLKTIEGIDLLPFHTIGKDKYRRLGLIDSMAGTAAPAAKAVQAIKHRFESAGFTVGIGG